MFAPRKILFLIPIITQAFLKCALLGPPCSIQKPKWILNAVNSQACLTVLHLQKLLLNSCSSTEHNRKKILAIFHSIVPHHYTDEKECWSCTLETASSSPFYHQSHPSARTGDTFCPSYSIAGGGSTPFFCDGKNLLVSWSQIHRPIFTASTPAYDSAISSSAA